MLSYDAKGEKTMGTDRETYAEWEERKQKLREIEAGAEFFTDAVYGDERAEDYWRKFLQTGSVSDYLNYAASTYKG